MIADIFSQCIPHDDDCENGEESDPRTRSRVLGYFMRQTKDFQILKDGLARLVGQSHLYEATDEGVRKDERTSYEYWMRNDQRSNTLYEYGSQSRFSVCFAFISPNCMPTILGQPEGPQRCDESDKRRRPREDNNSST